MIRLAQTRTYVYFEDDPFCREVFAIMMQRVIGTEHFIIFEDSAAFIDQLDALSEAPDVFFLDILITPQGGQEMLQILRSLERYCHAKMIAITASVTVDDVKNLRAIGFDGLIGKPFNPQSFGETLERILSGEKVWIV